MDKILNWQIIKLLDDFYIDVWKHFREILKLFLGGQDRLHNLRLLRRMGLTEAFRP